MAGAPFRVIETAAMGGRRNIAWDQALIEAHRAGRIGDTIRFLHFRPSALVGLHQYVGQELRVEYCRAHGIEIARRITGGGAIVFGPGQLGWELVFHRASLGLADLGAVAARICAAAAAGLARLGVAATFRPRNDIEVDGRKISGSGGFCDGDTLFYQGTLLVDCDPAAMVAALRVPAAKLSRHGLDAAADRMTTLRRLLGDSMPGMEAVRDALLAGLADGLGLDVARDSPAAWEDAAAQRCHDDDIGTDGFVYRLDRPACGADTVSASRAAAGGTVHACLRLEGVRRDRIREAVIGGDFFVTPPRLVRDLEAALRGVGVAEAGATVERFFTAAGAGTLGLAPAAFRAVIEAALGSARP